MAKNTSRKSRNTQKAPKRDIAAHAYRRVERAAMRPDDSLFVVTLIGIATLVAWFLTGA
jgi:hypothetical protein